MVLVHGQLVAAVAPITVIRTFSTSYFANAALVAVIDSFLLAHVVIQRANVAIVLRESLFAAYAGV